MADHTSKPENIFKNLGSPNFDEESAKIVLASNIDRMIEVRAMPQREAADFLGISQSKIRALRNGQLKGFTINYLFALLKKLDHDIEKHLLEEYREQCLCWKHDDDMFSKLTAILFPLSIAALTLPYLKPGTPKLLCVVGGLMLIAHWFFTSESFEDRSNIRWSRIHEIERILGFDSHLRIDRERQKSVWKGVPLRRLIFIVYIIIALFVTCDIKVAPVNSTVAHSLDRFIQFFSHTKVETALWTIDLWPTDAWTVKLVITFETLIVGVIVIVAADVCACIWTWKRVGKRAILTIWQKFKPSRKIAPVN